MRMIIGGSFQGKSDYARKTYPGTDWVDGRVCPYDAIRTCGGISHLETYIRRVMQEDDGGQYLKLLDSLVETNPEVIVISDEIGYGLVPVDSFERRYRETAGRICTRLAADARQVVRVVCGIGITIKQEEVCKEEQAESGLLKSIMCGSILPEKIEEKSFEMITEELGDTPLIPGTEPIVKRCIHTSADFDYAENLVFSKDVTERIQEALRNGASIVTDTQMAKAGINKKRLEKYGGKVYCFMSDEDVAGEAKRRKVTRAAVSMEKASKLDEELIFAIGNAPTALIRLYELIKEGKLLPKAVIAVPVGFVNVVQSKELILTLEDTPYIVARGRKGGSNIAACICNALLYMME